MLSGSGPRTLYSRFLLFHLTPVKSFSTLKSTHLPTPLFSAHSPHLAHQRKPYYSCSSAFFACRVLAPPRSSSSQTARLGQGVQQGVSLPETILHLCV